MDDSAEDTRPPGLTRQHMGIAPGLPLAASEGGIEALRGDIQRLFDIEAIKQLKHAYFRCLDTVNWDELQALFHPDISVHFIGGSYEWRFQGRDEYLTALRRSFHRQSIGQHNGHSPEIQLLGSTEATGIWYLADHMWMLNHRHLTSGTALYWDRYEKLEGRWVIRSTCYRRIYEMHQPIATPLTLGAHYLAEHGAPPDEG